MNVDELIEALDGRQIDGIVNMPSIGIYNIIKTDNLKMFVRSIYEYGKRDGIAECKNIVVRNIFE